MCRRLRSLLAGIGCEQMVTLVIGHADDQLAEVAPFEQADKRLRRVLQAIDNLFAEFDLAL